MTARKSSGHPRPDGQAAPETLVDVLQRQALRAPNEDAFLWLENGEREAGRITFAGLDRRARSIARLVLDHGLGNLPVLLVYPSGLDLLAALFGCFHAGAIAVVAAPPGPQSPDRIRALAIDSSAAGMLTVAALAARVAEEAPAGVRVLTTDGVDEEAGFSPPASPGPQSLAMLQYTSGSTTTPRGVMLTHANLLSNLRAMAQATEVSEGETAVSWLPFHHDMGLFGFGFFPIFSDLRCVLMPPVAFLKRPARWLEAIDRYRGTLSAGPVFAYDLCERRTTPEQRASLDLSCWRIAVCGGEMIRPEVLERFAETFAPAGFRSAALAPAYGLAEATLLAASVKAGGGFEVCSVDGPSLAGGRAAPPASLERTRRLVSCGHPWPGHELIVVDPVSRMVAPPGEVGEIWLRSASISQGYWRRPSETAEMFDATLCDGDRSGGWLRTGDLGFMSVEGLVVAGRRKDMIIVRGANFDPLDLEVAAEESHPALSPGGGGAFSIDDAAGEQVVLVHEVERAAMRSLDSGAVVARVAETMSLNFGLTLYDLVLIRSGALPRTTSGKVQRHLCREKYVKGELPHLVESRHPELGRWRPKAPVAGGSRNGGAR
jgi:acyl-CoA synthetase (AMP-forming)/AMP-acid ligase II